MPRMHDREERLAMNEVLFRKANDRIEESADHHTPPIREPIAFYCECSDRDCTERIPISADEFENVREHDAQFIVRPDHDVSSVEKVVTRTSLYLVVEKTGEAAEFVTEQLDDTGR
jgi:hypothetical protein